MPSRCPGARRLGMHRNDRRLQGVGPDAAAGQGPLDQAEPLDDQSTIPQSAVLLVEPHQFAAGRDPRLAPRVVQQHQGEQAEGLGVGQQLDQQAADADRLAAEIGAGQAGAGGGRVALVEHQVDHLQDVAQPLGEFLQGRYLVGNPGLADLVLGPHDALGDGAGRGEEGAGDLLGAQVADLAQGQRHLCLGGQRRVAAGEDQA